MSTPFTVTAYKQPNIVKGEPDVEKKELPALAPTASVMLTQTLFAKDTLTVGSFVAKKTDTLNVLLKSDSEYIALMGALSDISHELMFDASERLKVEGLSPALIFGAMVSKCLQKGKDPSQVLMKGAMIVAYFGVNIRSEGKYSAEAKVWIDEVRSVLDITAPGPNTTFTWPRLAIGAPFLISKVLLYGKGKIVGRIPRGLPRFLAHPQGYMFLTDRFKELWCIWFVSWLTVVKRGIPPSVKEFQSAINRIMQRQWGHLAGMTTPWRRSVYFPDEEMTQGEHASILKKYISSSEVVNPVITDYPEFLLNELKIAATEPIIMFYHGSLDVTGVKNTLPYFTIPEQGSIDAFVVPAIEGLKARGRYQNGPRKVYYTSDFLKDVGSLDIMSGRIETGLDQYKIVHNARVQIQVPQEVIKLGPQKLIVPAPQPGRKNI